MKSKLYSPFTKENGGIKSIFDVEFNDLAQLKEKDIEEGFKIEYKKEFNSSVKKKIPKIITSFANENGGWLFIGIDENETEVNLISINDYELIINNMLKDLTSPVPKAFIKFLTPPEKDDEGVLIIYIPEGDNPPYISKGKIYRRVGSGSSPVKEIDDRYYVDKLYQKSEEFKNELEDFCQKDVSISNGEWHNGFKSMEGMCNIYLIPCFDLKLLGNLNQEELEKYIIDKSHERHLLPFSDFPPQYQDGSITLNMPFPKSQFTNKSIVFRNSNILDFYDKTVIWEQFFNGRAKIHVPISYYTNISNIINDIKDTCIGYEDENIFYDFEYIDGKNLIITLLTCIYQYLAFIRNLRNDFKEVRMIIEFEDIKKNVLYFMNESYQSILEDKGLVFAEKNYYRLNENFSRKKVDIGLFSIFVNIINILGVFGYSMKQSLKLMYSILSQSQT